MKKFISVLSCLLLVALMVFTMTACGGQPEIPLPDEGDGVVDKPTLGDIFDPDRPDYDFDNDYEYIRPDPPKTETRFDPDRDPAYASGGATEVTRMEAENADVKLIASFEDQWKNAYSDVNNLAFDFRLSNKLCTRNLNDTQTAGSSVDFNFMSDKSYTVKMRANISVHSGETYVPSDNFAIKSEGADNNGGIVYSYADMSDIEIPRENAEMLVSGGEVKSEYFYFAVVEVMVAIYEGETTISFEFDGSGKGCNIDYIELDTSANITGWDDSHYTDGDVADPENGTMWYVSKQPTDTEEGTFTAMKYIDGAYRSYNYGLPALKGANGALTEGYSSSVVDGKTQYSFDFKNGVYTFVEGEVIETTATIHSNSLIKFAGNKDTITKNAGDTLEASDFEIPEGETVYNVKVYDMNGNLLETATVGTWKFPVYEVTIEVAELLPEGTRILAKGKNAEVYADPGKWYYHSESSKVSGYAYNEEKSAVLNVNVTSSNGDYLRFMPENCKTGTSYKVSYRVTCTQAGYIRLSGGSGSATFTQIAANETIDITFTLKAAKDKPLSLSLTSSADNSYATGNYSLKVELLGVE